MGKRKNGEGSWATVTKKGYTYKRFRSLEGREFFGKTEKEAKAKYMQWKEKVKIIYLIRRLLYIKWLNAGLSAKKSISRLLPMMDTNTL